MDELDLVKIRVVRGVLVTGTGTHRIGDEVIVEAHEAEALIRQGVAVGVTRRISLEVSL